MRIGNRDIGKDNSVFIIAELSANHMQDYDLAVETLKAAAEAGADAFKLQTLQPDKITLNCNNEYFYIDQGTLWDGKTLYELYQETYTPWEWHKELKTLAEKLGMECFSSPFDLSAVDFLESINVPAYKVASYEITDLPLIEYIAKKNKPIIISTGLATLSDIEAAVNICKKVGNNEIALLKCTSAYPASFEEVNLRTILNIRDTFSVEVGLSDHTKGIVVPVAAVALGAKIVEKHFILNKNLDSPDVEFSLDPHEFKKMVDAIRIVEKSLGKVTYKLTPKAKRNREHVRSLFISANMKKGDVFCIDNVQSVRPGDGLHPKYLKDIIGKRVKKDVDFGTPLRWDLVDNK